MPGLSRATEAALNFQDMIFSLNRYWAKRGCSVLQPCGLEICAAIYSPAAFFTVLAPGPAALACAELVRRPGDARFGEDPLRLGRGFEYQVLLKPPRGDMQEALLGSLRETGADLQEHDVRWVEDGRELAALGASGTGWEVLLDGVEVARLTYYQRMASLDLDPVSAEISVCLERLAVLLQKKKTVFEVDWSDSLAYGELFGAWERQFSRYNFELADAAALERGFESQAEEAERLLASGQYLPAYELVLKCNRCLDLLESRSPLPAGRPGMLKRVRALAGLCAGAHAAAAVAAKGRQHG